MKYFFTSDTHFNHDNIIKFCNRPFKSVERMNEVLIKNWNARVKPEDTVIHLGDFCYKAKTKLNPQEIIDRLNGNIVFVKGNHDNNNGLNSRITSLVMEIGNRTVYCVHNPGDFNPHIRLNLVGHVHENWRVTKRKRRKCILVNVGVDVWNYHPVTINEILKCIGE